jgi:hypothetical protein
MDCQVGPPRLLDFSCQVCSKAWATDPGNTVSSCLLQFKVSAHVKGVTIEMSQSVSLQVWIWRHHHRAFPADVTRVSVKVFFPLNETVEAISQTFSCPEMPHVESPCNIQQ